jgi:hypothetical protein
LAKKIQTEALPDIASALEHDAEKWVSVSRLREASGSVRRLV